MFIEMDDGNVYDVPGPEYRDAVERELIAECSTCQTRGDVEAHAHFGQLQPADWADYEIA